MLELCQFRSQGPKDAGAADAASGGSCDETPRPRSGSILTAWFLLFFCLVHIFSLLPRVDLPECHAARDSEDPLAVSTGAGIVLIVVVVPTVLFLLFDVLFLESLAVFYCYTGLRSSACESLFSRAVELVDESLLCGGFNTIVAEIRAESRKAAQVSLDEKH